jgi:hypothetical protein
MWGPLKPKWFRASGTKRIVEEEDTGLTYLMSLPNLAVSDTLRTKSELLQEEDKHGLARPEALTTSNAVSSM